MSIDKVKAKFQPKPDLFGCIGYSELKGNVPFKFMGEIGKVKHIKLADPLNFTGSANRVTTQPGIGVGDNFLCTFSENGTINCTGETILSFEKPVNDLTFLQVGDNASGIVALVDVFEDNLFSSTVNIIGTNDFFVPNLVDLSDFNNVTSIRIYDITDPGGLGWDNFQFTTSTADEFDILFSAFIPHDNVPGPFFDFCFDTSEIIPDKRSIFYKGDTRTFSPSSDSFRTRQIVTVISEQESDADGLKEGSIQNPIGPTRSYASDALANNGTIDSLDDDGIPDDCRLFHQAGQATPTDGRRKMKVTVERLTEHKVKVNLFGGPGNPLSGPAQRIGTLDWDFEITIDTSGDNPEWTLEGAHDGFPAYEIYINGIEIYTKNPPGSPPYKFQGQVSNLLGGLDVSVSKSGTLP